MIQRIAVIAAWLALAFIAFATLSPIGARPSVASPHLEHFAAFALTGLAFAVAYPNRILLVVVIVAGAALGLEAGDGEAARTARGRRPGRPLPALNLSADQAVVTALGNDVGFDLIFSRQIIAHARSRDIAVAFSTSGSSRDLMAALREARGRGLLTVGFAGYDGGEMAHSDVVDYCFVVRSQSVHRIQESQALLGYHLWAATKQAMHKTVDRCVHPDVHNGPSSGPNPYGGTE